MEIKEAIERLKEYHDNSVIFSETVGEEKDYFAVALEIAISALEKQVEKRPYPDDDDSILACPYCGSGEYLHNPDENENQYCGQCGQKIDWSE